HAAGSFAGDEGQAARRGDVGSAEVLPGAGGACTQGAGTAGRKALGGVGQEMKRVIAIANQKGGVGKTTTAGELARSLTATKRRVLLIDLDPQGNATMGCGIDKNALARTSCDVLLSECSAVEAMVPVDYGGFMLLPANQDLTAAEVRLLTMAVGREFKLR